MTTLKYLELFAGTGVAGMALDKHGFECVGYSEIDVSAIKNYSSNFPGKRNFGDITQILPDDLPDFDVLIGGSPCQNLSIVQSNKEGRGGLAGEQSRLFYEYVRILNGKLPSYFIYENVRNLLNANDGKDMEVATQLLGENYNIHWQLLNTSDYGVPQTRRRVYIVGKRKNVGELKYEFPQPVELTLTAQDLLEEQVNDRYYLSQKMYEYVMSSGTKNFSAKPETDLKIARPVTASMFKMHRAGTDSYFHTTYQPEGKTNLRRLTPREAARLQGIPDTYKIEVSDTQAYRLFGNAMSLNVVQAVVTQLLHGRARRPERTREAIESGVTA